MAGAHAGAVGQRIPLCDTCNIPIIINGCWECGHLFSRWDELLEWDPKARDNMHTSEAFLRAAKLLGEQVRNEATRLAHERASLEDLKEKTRLKPSMLNFDDEPPPPSGLT